MTSTKPWPEEIEIAGRCCMPFLAIHALVARYIHDWNTAILAAQWRKSYAHFCRLPSGEWGVSVPCALAERECDGDYVVDVRRKNGTTAPVRVKPMFTLRRWSIEIEICEIAGKSR